MTPEIVLTKLVSANTDSLIQIDSKKINGQKAIPLLQTGYLVGISHRHGINNDLSCVVIKQHREKRQRPTTNLSFFFQNIEDIKVLKQ